MREKRFSHYRSQWPWSQICSFSYSYFSTKLEVSTAFLFRENQRHGTDGQADGQMEDCRVTLLCVDVI